MRGPSGRASDAQSFHAGEKGVAHETMRFWSTFNAWLAQEFVILGVSSDPEPEHSIRNLDGECAIVKTNSG
jgi:hypothetical protein